MKKKIGYARRPRFGWCDDLDNDPQIIWEKKGPNANMPVVLIPLMFMSPKLKKQFREIARKLWSGIP